jgi:hypothetical protein
MNTFYVCDNKTCTVNKYCTEESATCFQNINDCNYYCSKTPSLDEYCYKPNDYKDILSNSEILTYNKRCNALSGQSKISFGAEKITTQGLSSFLDGIFRTPSGLEMLSVLLGFTVTEKFALQLRENIVKYINKTFFQTVEKNAAKIGVEAAADISAGILGSVLRATTETVFLPFTLVMPLLNAANYILLPLQIITIIIDSWDPCDLNQEIDPDSLNELSYKFNTSFLASLDYDTKEDINKRIIYKLNSWPKEYVLNGQIYNAVKTLGLEQEFQDKYQQYLMIYIANSTDLPTSTDSTNILNPEDLSFLKPLNTLFYKASNENTVVEKFLKTYWPIIILIVFLIIFFIIIAFNK